MKGYRNIELPDAQKVIEEISSITVIRESDKKSPETVTIADLVRKDVEFREENRQASKNTIFTHFVSDLLRRRARNGFLGFWKKDGKYVRKDGKRVAVEVNIKKNVTLNGIPCIDPDEIVDDRGRLNKITREKIEELLKSRKISEMDARNIVSLLDLLEGYTLGSGIAAYVIIGARQVLKKFYNDNWEEYLNEAEKKYKKNFQDDPFRDIKYVGPKVRDLALSSLSNKFVAIDVNVKNLLFRTGLICYSYPLNIEIGTNLGSETDYNDLRKLCLELCKDIRMSPMEFDRTLWHFGTRVCNNGRDCHSCQVDSCLTKRYL